MPNAASSNETLTLTRTSSPWRGRVRDAVPPKNASKMSPKPPKMSKPSKPPALLSRAVADACVAEAVVLLAAFGVTQDLVGLVDLLEALGGVAGLVAVGVILHRLLPEGFADIFLGRLGADAKHVVVVAFGGHGDEAITATGARVQAPARVR